ncbi:TerD family protein [Nocardia sp. NPDC005978]|uniref:TerD family protein n=1 Tax=unclassified Nocardia TaxID=2637762 RepID=UPI0033A3432F
MSIALVNPDGSALECVAVALGWDASDLDLVVPVDGALEPGVRVDLNVAALLFSADQLVDAVYYGQLSSRDGSVRHTGDNLTGEGAGDNEVIVLDLARLAPEVTSVIVVITSYSGQSFANIANAYCRLLDAGTDTEIHRYLLSGGPHTALVMGRFERFPVVWAYEGIGVGIPALHAAEAVPYVLQYLHSQAAQ